MKPKATEWNRRQFIRVSLNAGTGMVVSCQMPIPRNADACDHGGRAIHGFVPDAWIRIEPYDTVTVMIKHTEPGQGSSTGLCMIAAEELEADWSKVRFEFAAVAPIYKNPEIGVQATGGSTGVETSWDTLRLAGATAGELPISAAAATWNVPASECRAKDSIVFHRPGKRRLRYGELIQQEQALTPIEAPRLKAPEQLRIIGRTYSRLDAMDKARGRTLYDMDIRLPGLLTAAVTHAPMLGGKPAPVDEREARTLPGVKAVVILESAVAVVAEVSFERKGRVRVHRMVCAVDCAPAVNPKPAKAQIVGGAVFGLTATLKGRIQVCQKLGHGFR